MKVSNKADMYRRLAAGEFGNTIPQHFSVEAWAATPESKSGLWGIRSSRVSMHPAARLNCPAEEVAEYAATHFSDGVNISMMVDATARVTAFLEVFRSADGLVVEGVEYPKFWDGWNWRNSMHDPSRRRSWIRLGALALLDHHLNANSREDLELLLDRYPDHVVELSALGRAVGTIPYRNAVVWEVRAY